MREEELLKVLELEGIPTSLKENIEYILAKKGCSERNKDIFKDYYFEDLSLKEIALKNSLSSTRTAQIVANAARALRTPCYRRVLVNGIEAIQEKACLEDSVETLELSARTQNCLRRVKIRTVEDLVNYGYDNLLKITNFGKKRLDEVIKTLQDNGFYLKDQDARGYNENILEEAQALEKICKNFKKGGQWRRNFC